MVPEKICFNILRGIWVTYTEPLGLAYSHCLTSVNISHIPNATYILPSPKVIGPLLLEKILKDVFFDISARRQSWSCEQDHLNTLSFQYPRGSPCEI